jgi:Family of unknown function (DUF6011)/Family of unknown function (DUF6166)
MNCYICKRKLTDPKSIEAGIGPICASKILSGVDEQENNHMKLLSTPLNNENGVILKRTENGVKTNVPWLIKDHSPDGYEWGYLGSGPADLALNIIEVVLRQMGHSGSKIKILWSGDTCFNRAYSIHQGFKRDFIARMPKEGGIIPLADIKNWIRANTPTQRSLF